VVLYLAHAQTISAPICIGFKTRAFAICDKRSRGKQALTGTPKDATARYSSASWHKMGMLLLDY